MAYYYGKREGVLYWYCIEHHDGTRLILYDVRHKSRWHLPPSTVILSIRNPSKSNKLIKRACHP